MIAYLGLPGKIDLDASFYSTAHNNQSLQFFPQINIALRAQIWREDPILSFPTSAIVSPVQ